MSRVYAYTESFTTNGIGGATVYFGKKITGEVVALKYAPTDLNASTSLNLSGENDKQSILVILGAGATTVWFRPVVLGNKYPSLSAAQYTDCGVCPFLHEERAKLTVALGGIGKTGSVTLYVRQP